MSLWKLVIIENEDTTVRCPFYDDWVTTVPLKDYPTFDIGEKPTVYCIACMFPHPLPGPYGRYTQVHGKRPNWDPVEDETPEEDVSIEAKLKEAEETIKNESRKHLKQDGPVDRDEI